MSGSNVMSALGQSLRRPAFLAVVLVLLVGGVTINGAAQAMKLHFRKEAVSLRTPQNSLSPIPTELGDWVSVPEAHTIDADTVHELQTDKYLFRRYVNVKATDTAGALITSREKIKSLEQLGEKQRLVEVDRIINRNPAAVISFAITYYTGKVDTVPHVPDRCYVADGYQPSVYLVEPWDLGQYANKSPRQVKVRFIDFSDQTSRGATNRCVTYFFHANGSYEEDPLQVRLRLQNLRERYGYFAKIECMTVLPVRQEGDERGKATDRELAAASMKKFLSAALPEVEKVLPDWEALKKQSAAK